MWFQTRKRVCILVIVQVERMFLRAGLVLPLSLNKMAFISTVLGSVASFALPACCGLVKLALSSAVPFNFAILS